MHAAAHRRVLGAVTTLAVLAGMTAAPVRAAGRPGALAGRIFAADARTPLAGATVKAAHLASETVFESAPADAGGRFALNDLPAGSYDLAVATSRGLYPTRRTIVVADGQTRVLSLALAPAAAEEEGTEPPAPEGEPKEEAKEDDDDGGAGFWDRPYVAALTILGFSIAFGVGADEILGDDEQPEEVNASASTP